MTTVIRVENLGKKYRIQHQQQERYTTLRDAVAYRAKSLFGRNSQFSIENSQLTEDFWALKDVSFEIKQGEVVGIIGRNGAGKSTLLKILSRITEPTTGRVRIKGRIASLLEVGTGFHPELTGRENIFLNGAILGMTKEEIKRKFNEIVAFAEVENFLDTPVKRYSSGMYVRLAFAVAAYLEPEILIVDEVLAVGDAQFQKKCLGKMGEVGKTGRTVLFVSHNMAAVQALCTRAIHLQAGIVVSQGTVKEVTERYLIYVQSSGIQMLASSMALGPNLNLRKFEFSPNPSQSGTEQRFCIEIEPVRSDRIESLVILIHSLIGQRIAIMDLRSLGCPFEVSDKVLTICGSIHSLPFVEGDYFIGLYIESQGIKEDFPYLAKLTITSKQLEEGTLPYPSNVRGVVELHYEAQVR